jgi:hypothetical protein
MELSLTGIKESVDLGLHLLGKQQSRRTRLRTFAAIGESAL